MLTFYGIRIWQQSGPALQHSGSDSLKIISGIHAALSQKLAIQCAARPEVSPLQG